MSFERINPCTRGLGLYRVARWVNRNFINRSELHAYRGDLKLYRQFIKPGSLCFDVGANYGAKSEVFLKLGAKVVAFEPQQDCYQEMHARLGKNSRLITIQAAVGSEPGTATMHIEKLRTASSLIQNWQGEIEGAIEVPVTTLDEVIAEHGVPDFCKIDVEGFELEVLQGLSHRLPALSLEYHLRDAGKQKVVNCLEYLEQFGKLLLNIVPAKSSELACPTWQEKSEFLEFFFNSVPNMTGFDYGDIYVKIEV